MKDGTNLKEQLEREGGVFLENIQDSFVNSLTHLIIFDEHGENLYKILKLPLEETKHIHIVTEHWVEDSIKSKTRIAETSYLVPINESERQKVQENPLGIAIIPPHFFIGHSFYFHQYEDLLNAKTSLLDLHSKISKSTDIALCNPIISLIHRAGGKVYNSFGEIPSNEPCFIIAPYKDTTLKENMQKLLFGAKLRTIFWLADAVRAANLNLEPTHILHFPRPSYPKTIIENMKISVTGYTGIERERIKAMIVLLGGTYTGYFAVGHDLLISFPCSQSDKLSKAKEWKIPVVTHVWLENTFSTWTKVPFTELSEGIKNFENDPDKIITKGIVSESLLIPQESQNVELLVNGTDSAEKENFSVSPQANQNLRDDSAPFVKTKRGRKPSQKTVNKRKSVENTGAVLVSNDEQTKGMPLQEILVEETIFEKEKDTKSAKNTNSKRKVESSLVDSNSEDIKKVVNLPSVSATGIRFSEEEQAAFLCMGGSLAKSLESSTHLIAAKISRTEKFLKAIPLGLFIVTPDWFYDSVAVGKFLDESTYMLKDSLMEEKFHFSLQESLSRAKNSQIFTSMTFYIMERTTPPFKILEDIIVCAGGKVLKPLPRKKLESEVPDEAIIIHAEACLLAPKLFPGKTLQSTEWVLTSVLTQQLK